MGRFDQKLAKARYLAGQVQNRANFPASEDIIPLVKEALLDQVPGYVFSFILEKRRCHFHEREVK